MHVEILEPVRKWWWVVFVLYQVWFLFLVLIQVPLCTLALCILALASTSTHSLHSPPTLSLTWPCRYCST